MKRRSFVSILQPVFFNKKVNLLQFSLKIGTTDYFELNFFYEKIGQLASKTRQWV